LLLILILPKKQQILRCTQDDKSQEG